MYVHQCETISVYDLGLFQFKDEILHHQLVREHLRNTLLAMIGQERRGEIVDRYVEITYVHKVTFSFWVCFHKGRQKGGLRAPGLHPGGK